MATPKTTRTKPPGAKKTGSKKSKPASDGATATLDTDDQDEPTRSSSPGHAIDAEVLEFIAALDRFKKEHNRNFPSWSEVLHVLKGLGYSRS